MKIKITILLSLLLLFSCNSKKTNRTVITGEILNLEGEISLIGPVSKLNSSANNNGKFKIVAEIPNPNYYRLRTGKSEIMLFLFPGDSINISFVNAERISIIQFTGDRINELNYLLDYCKIYNSIADTFDLAKYYSPEANQFLATVNNYREVFLNNLNNYHKLNREFEDLEKQRINYIWAWDKNTYPKNHLLYTRKKAILPSNYFDYLKDLNLNDTSLMKLNDYTDFLKTYVDMKYFLEVQDDNAKASNKYLKTKLQLDIIESNFSNQKIRNFLFNNLMISQIENLAVDSTDIIKFESWCTDQNYKANVVNKYNSISSILKGEPVPDFKITQGNKTYSFSDFKGKYLYIDFWATTCAPCIREIPYLNELEKEFKGKNIAFLGICIESKKEAWQKIMSEKKPSGIQVWLDKEQSDKIKQNFKITSEPTYVLIDKNGNYIDSRAPRPSENVSDVLKHLSGL